MALYWTCSSLFAPAQSWVVNKYYNAAILNAKAEAQRLAKIKLEEESVISATYSKKGVKKFAPIYSLPEPTTEAAPGTVDAASDVPSNDLGGQSGKKSGASKKKKGGSKGKQSSADYQGKKKK